MGGSAHGERENSGPVYDEKSAATVLIGHLVIAKKGTHANVVPPKLFLHDAFAHIGAVIPGHHLACGRKPSLDSLKWFRMRT
jgi:hypothetical protein